MPLNLSQKASRAPLSVSKSFFLPTASETSWSDWLTLQQPQRCTKWPTADEKWPKGCKKVTAKRCRTSTDSFQGKKNTKLQTMRRERHKMTKKGCKMLTKREKSTQNDHFIFISFSGFLVINIFRPKLPWLDSDVTQTQQLRGHSDPPESSLDSHPICKPPNTSDFLFFTPFHPSFISSFGTIHRAEALSQLFSESATIQSKVLGFPAQPHPRHNLNAQLGALAWTSQSSWATVTLQEDLHTLTHAIFVLSLSSVTALHHHNLHYQCHQSRSRNSTKVEKAADHNINLGQTAICDLSKHDVKCQTKSDVSPALFIWSIIQVSWAAEKTHLVTPIKAYFSAAT